VFRLFDGIESLEAHNNVIFQTGSGDAQIVRDAEAEWVGGVRRVAGVANFVIEGTGVRDVPPEWEGTLRGADPMFEAASADDYRPADTSNLVDAADPSPRGVPGYAFPRPELSPFYVPPFRGPLAVGTAAARPIVGAELDIGAFELGSGPVVPTDGGVCAPQCGTEGEPRACGDDGCGGSCGLCVLPATCGADGRCACASPRIECDGRCIDPRSEPDHCGGCGAVCGAAEVCSSGACTDECAAGSAPCDRACVDLTSDPLHCGDCRTMCPSIASCVEGLCRPDRIEDAGTTPPVTTDPGGCGCRSSGEGHDIGFGLALLVAALVLRTRGRRRPQTQRRQT
jgi:MYXO-CTERM domain-containing protein